jgi:large subunit ribosomal protein L37Ae
MRTKKVGSSGRFGARYGRKIKLNIKKTEQSQRKKYRCPDCRAQKIQRVSAGVWSCRKCGLTFAGGAYNPTTGPESATGEI